MEPHLRAKLLTIPTVLDGRRGAFTTGFRPQFRYRGQENDVSITIPGDIWIESGDSTDALLSFYRPDLQQSRLQLGSSFTLAEGRKNIATGTITDILDQKMNDPEQKRESVIFIDVDDTLIRSYGTKQIPIPNAIRYVRDMFDAGNVLYCWSRGGAQYSRDLAIRLGIADCFVCFLPKPDVVVDDRLEQLLAHCEFIHPNNAVTKPEATKSGKDARFRAPSPHHLACGSGRVGSTHGSAAAAPPAKLTNHSSSRHHLQSSWPYAKVLCDSCRVGSLSVETHSSSPRNPDRTQESGFVRWLVGSNGRLAFQRGRNQVGNSVMVMPSGPGAPRLAFTFFQASSMLASSTNASVRDIGNKLKAGFSSDADAASSG